MIPPPDGRASWFLNRQHFRCAHMKVVITGALVVKVPRKGKPDVAAGLCWIITTINLLSHIRGVNPCWHVDGKLIERYAGRRAEPSAAVKDERRRIGREIEAEGYVLPGDFYANKNWCFDPETRRLTIVDLANIKTRPRRRVRR
jgi:hypothetical protein